MIGTLATPHAGTVMGEGSVLSLEEVAMPSPLSRLPRPRPRSNETGLITLHRMVRNDFSLSAR